MTYFERTVELTSGGPVTIYGELGAGAPLRDRRLVSGLLAAFEVYEREQLDALGQEAEREAAEDPRVKGIAT